MSANYVDADEPLLFLNSDSDGETTEQLIARRRKRREQQFTPHFRQQIDGGQSIFTFSTRGVSTTVNLDYLKHGTGSSVWDSAVVLMKCFENSAIFPEGCFKGKRVLEIGAGTGILGITTAKLGAESVVLTDLGELVDALKANIALNGLQDRATAQEYLWGTSIDVLNPPFDVILCADCILPYSVDAMPALCKTLGDLCKARRGTVTYMAYEERFDASHFFRLAESEDLCVEEIPREEHHSEYSSEMIHIYRITSASIPGSLALVRTCDGTSCSQ
jgi:nicotinamide N-methyltransferase